MEPTNAPSTSPPPSANPPSSSPTTTHGPAQTITTTSGAANLPAHPPYPRPSYWDCHVCGRTWRFGVTARCLRCGHHFCTETSAARDARRLRPVSPTLSPRGRLEAERAEARARRNPRGPCRTDIEYADLRRWGRFRRGRAWQLRRAAALQAVAAERAADRAALLAQEDVAAYDDGDEDEDEYTAAEEGEEPEYDDDDELRDTLFIYAEHDCSLHCDFPSQCREVRETYEEANRTVQWDEEEEPSDDSVDSDPYSSDEERGDDRRGEYDDEDDEDEFAYAWDGAWSGGPTASLEEDEALTEFGDDSADVAEPDSGAASSDLEAAWDPWDLMSFLLADQAGGMAVDEDEGEGQGEGEERLVLYENPWDPASPPTGAVGQREEEEENDEADEDMIDWGDPADVAGDEESPALPAPPPPSNAAVDYDGDEEMADIDDDPAAEASEEGGGSSSGSSDTAEEPEAEEPEAEEEEQQPGAQEGQPEAEEDQPDDEQPDEAESEEAKPEEKPRRRRGIGRREEQWAIENAPAPRSWLRSGRERRA